MDPGKAYALALMQKHRDMIAASVVAQVDASVPEFQHIDKSARIQSVGALIDNAVEAMRGHGHTALLNIVRGISDLRRMGGLSMKALIASGHCYLPVVRRVFMAKAKDPLEGLRAFEQIEGDLLRLIIEGTTSVLPDEIDDDDEDTITDPRGKRITLAPFSEFG